MKADAIAVLDAALAYGAARWYRGVHQDNAWEYQGKYKAGDDQLLFFQFLHDLVLYDQILLDRSSVGEHVSDEILDLFRKINSSESIVDADRAIAPFSPSSIGPIVGAVCKLVSDADQIPDTSKRIRSLVVPWAYSSPKHFDAARFAEALQDWKLHYSLLPLAIFLYRGLCYAGYAHNYRNRYSIPTVYLASPGRIKALEPFLSSAEIKRLRYPSHAYADLVKLLQLPNSGYRFTHMPSLPVHYLSELTHELYSKTPAEALSLVLRLRQSEEGRLLRQRWAERVWESSDSAALGINYTQTINGATISGDLTMIIHAAAEA